ncbi:MAG: tetraacyldisaccharide 4'-kinase [Candidatus Acidiferrales bacterium]
MSLRDALLRPLALPYEMVVRLRAQAYRRGLLRPKRIQGVVISVGNLTVGGTGKTPMVLWIAHRLLAEKRSVGILTRGYGGKSVSTDTQPGTGTATETTSDEVRLLKARLGEGVAWGVGADRFAQGQGLAKRGVQWFILDDGFQHRQLARDVDIVLIDATNPFGGGHLLPAGQLREPRSALARADIIVITRSDHAPAIEAAVRHDSAAPTFYARPGLDSIRTANDAGRVEVPTAETQRKKLFAFCGIGNPSAFLMNLRDWGFEIVGHRFFRDHHRYTQQDATAIETEARKRGADALLCTEKDVFNLNGVLWNDLGVLYCRMSLVVDREEEFWRAIIAKSESSRNISRKP